MSSSPGMEILRHAYFRVTRDADFTVSDEADDLLRAVEDELRRRRFGEAVRLEVSHDMDPRMREYLIEQLAHRRGPGGRRGRAARPRRTSGRSTTWTATASSAIRPGNRCPSPSRASARTDARTCSRPCARGDMLVHHPYHSFAGSVERFVQQAVADPDVLAMKMTVYRTSDDSVSCRR